MGHLAVGAVGWHGCYFEWPCFRLWKDGKAFSCQAVGTTAVEVMRLLGGTQIRIFVLMNVSKSYLLRKLGISKRPHEKL